MKPKNLIPLVIVMAILAGLVVMKKNRAQHPTIIQQAGLVKVLPDGLAKGDIAKLEIYAGAMADQKVVLAFDDAAKKWRVTSHFNAPVKQDEIDKYLDAVLKMQGEPREQNVADTDLEQYELTDAKAFHVVGYKKDAKDPLFHMLVGKAPGYGSVFIRKADGKDVYVENTDLRQQAGVMENERPPMMMPGMPEPPKDNTPKKPEASMWLDKEIAKIDVSKATKLALTTPDKTLTFERREKPKAPEAAKPAEETKPAEAGKPGDAAKAADAAKPVEAAKGPEFEWVAASGAEGLKMKPESVMSLLGKLSPLSAADVMDPAKKAEYGLDTPAYTCVVTFDGLPELRLEAGRPNAANDGYVRIAGAKEEVVYSLGKAVFDQLFSRGGDLFELQGLTADANTMTSIELTQPDGKLVLTKAAKAPEAPEALQPEGMPKNKMPSSDKWDLQNPIPGMKLQESALSGVASAVSTWKPVDFAAATAALGEPTRVAAIASAAGAHTLKLYGDAKTSDGAYVRVDDNPAVYVMSRADVNRIFVSAKDVYDRSVVGLQEEDIDTIAYTSPNGAFSVKRESEEAWKLDVAGVASEAKVEQCTTLAADLASLRAEDLLFNQKELPEPAETTIQLKTKDGADHTLTFTAEKEGKRYLKVSGKDFICVVKTETLSGCFPTADSLKNAVSMPAPQSPVALPEGAAATPIQNGAVVVPTPTPAAPAPQPSVAPSMPTPPAPATVPAAAPAAPAPAAPAPEEKK